MRRRTIKPRGRLSDALIDAGDVLFRLAAWIDPGPDGEPCPDCGVPTTVPLDEPCPECEVRFGGARA